MRLLTEYLSIHVKSTKIVATDDTIEQIMIDEMRRLGPNGDFNHVDVLKCTSFKYLFDAFGNSGEKHELYKKFNGDISEWNTKNIKNMCCVFRGCSKFNCDLSNWDVSEVIDMDHIFCNCRKFNKPLNNWKVDKVTMMGGMFCGAEKFNQPLDHWKTNSVTYMGNMFTDAYEFNQDISMWDVSRVDNTVDIFKNCPIEREFMPKFNRPT
jgi:surface protein